MPSALRTAANNRNSGAMQENKAIDGMCKESRTVAVPMYTTLQGAQLVGNTRTVLQVQVVEVPCWK